MTQKALKKVRAANRYYLRIGSWTRKEKRFRRNAIRSYKTHNGLLCIFCPEIETYKTENVMCRMLELGGRQRAKKKL